MVRKKLGIAKWKVFGQSYGAFIAHRYMAVAPEGVVSAHAHANTLNSDAFDRMTNRIGAQGRVLGEYLKRFPSDEASLKILSTSLTPSTCITHESNGAEMKACGYEFTQTLVKMLGFSDNWFKLHQWVDYLVRDGQVDMKNLREFAIGNVFSSGGGGIGRSVAMMVLGYGDRNVETPNFITDYHGCKAIFDELKKRGFKDPESWPINECASTYQAGDNEASKQYREEALKIFKVVTPDHLTIDAFKAALVAHPEIPMYVYSGEMDTFVPRESFVEEVTALGSLIKYHHFMGTGHEGFYMEGLVWRNLAL
jgi:pimeloyl-ACP methyl ester carboxylesterase